VYKKNGRYYVFSTEGHHGPYSSLKEILTAESNIFKTQYTLADIRYGKSLQKRPDLDKKPPMIGRKRRRKHG